MIKRSIEPISRGRMLQQFPIEIPDIPGWYFRQREQSAGVWNVEGRDAYGRAVGRTGVDADEVLQECAQDARAILSST
jgi:hypothetical protein